jgi:hypothetical protein
VGCLVSFTTICETALRRFADHHWLPMHGRRLKAAGSLCRICAEIHLQQPEDVSLIVVLRWAISASFTRGGKPAVFDLQLTDRARQEMAAVLFAVAAIAGILSTVRYQTVYYSLVNSFPPQFQDDARD